MKDIRINTGIFQHPKVVKLRSRHGADGVLALMQLWIYTAINSPKGILAEMDPETIAIAAQWNGGESWVSDLLDLKLVDEIPDGFRIHDWQDHNGYAYYAPERSEKAKLAAKERWRGKSDNKQEPNASGIAECDAPSPLPSPSPTLREKKRNETGEKGKSRSTVTLAEAIASGVVE
jgi:hypothetical protein